MSAEFIAYLVAAVAISLIVGGVVGWRLGTTAEQKRLRETRGEMENAFKAMAIDIARQNSEDFLKQANVQFGALKTDSARDLDEKKKLIDQRLSGMNDTLKEISDKSTALKTSIDSNQQTTDQLRKILSSSQQRGQWGERMVEDILHFVGMQEKINYTKQSAVESGQRPDYTFILPRKKCVNMDVKFPLVHYENYLAATDDKTRADERASFLKDVRGHIKSVCTREYINPAKGTLEYVMIFIPNESIYGFINREDAKLIDYALEKRVLLCSPLTLYAVLSLIRQATRDFAMDEHVSKVIGLLAEFKKEWGKYIDQMDDMGKKFIRLSDAFKSLTTTRKDKLEAPLEKIDRIALPNRTDSDDDADAQKQLPK